MNHSSGFNDPPIYSDESHSDVDTDPQWQRDLRMRRLFLEGETVTLAKDQEGSRYIMRVMEEEPSMYKDMIFADVAENAGRLNGLVLDVFGNYVTQKLVEVCSQQQRTMILSKLTENPYLFIDLCLNCRGTRTVDKLMKKIATFDQISLFVGALCCGVVDLCMDLSGKRIIEYCLMNFEHEHTRHLLNVVIDNCVSIAKDTVGCCVLKMCIDHCDGESRGYLIAVITGEALVLAYHRYGNYVLQHLLGLGTPRVTSNLLRQFQGNYMDLSCTKSGSIVVEKCLLESNKEQSAAIIRELCSSPKLEDILMHPFGNYVFQTALSVSKGREHVFLLNLVRQSTPALMSNQCGRNVLNWHKRSPRPM